MRNNLIAIAILGAGTLAFAQQPKPAGPQLDTVEVDAIKSLQLESQALQAHIAKVQADISQRHPGYKLDPNNPFVLVADTPPAPKPVTPETKK